MSKFFNETIKVRNSVATVESVSQPAEPSHQNVQTGSANGEVIPLEQSGKLEMPLANYLRQRFPGSASMGPAEESYRALRTRLLRLQAAQALRSVVITSATQGEGKTLTSLNLALCCSQLHGMRVLLIDADIRSRGLTRLIGIRSGPGLADVLTGESKAHEAILATDSPNLFVLGGGSPTAPPAELLASQGLQELLNWCVESFHLVIVDSPPVLNLTDVELITASCDAVLMVVRALRTKREILQKSASRIDAKKLLGIVFNAVESRPHRDYYQYHRGDGPADGHS